MRLVVLESPYAARAGRTVEDHVEYARRCLRDCLDRGEAPVASHLLYTQVWDDANAHQRRMGLHAGWAWQAVADAVVVYLDYGVSPGMEAGIAYAAGLGVEIEYRRLGI